MCSETGTVIVADQLGKCYEMYTKAHHRLLQTLWRGKRQFFQEFWALRDVSFSADAGECVGVIGRNGAGKSTLLQLLVGTLTPTEGFTQIQGRVAALLELGAGFNPEFTGRENVFLHGVVLGLTRGEIRRRFDAIADFAEIGEFMDRPVKNYSTGMVVRLAFAVQAQLEPDVLIIDEVLAVGDAAFQMKCMERINRLRDSGMTVLLASHSVNTVRQFCDRCIWLDRGRIRQIGDPAEVTSAYMEYLFSGSTTGGSARDTTSSQTQAKKQELLPLESIERHRRLRRWGSGEFRIEAAGMFDQTGAPRASFQHGEDLTVRFRVRVVSVALPGHLAVAFALRNVQGIDMVAISTYEDGHILTVPKPGEDFEIAFSLENILAPGEYALVTAVEDLQDGRRRYYDYVENTILFSVTSGRRVLGQVEPKVHWHVLPSA
jgi:lipopolysaccharide transport system ATP-binding protein